MPDLLTHLASARLPAAFPRTPQVRAALLLGCLLPDLASKPLYGLAHAPSDYLEPFHSLAGLLVLCYAVSLFFPRPLREKTFAALYGGSLLHVALDLIKDNLGVGSASLFYPFSTRGYELGWIDPEDVILLIPAALALLALTLGVEWRLRRVRQ